MSDGLFNQPFVYCGVCHRQSTREDPLHLTSCAHILCSEHLNTTACPICKNRDVMAIRLVENKQLPQDIGDLFRPMSTLLENLYIVSQFQSSGLVNQCHYYQEHCIKLREKCARQRQLLCQAKHELDSVARLKSRITELEAVLAKQEDSSGQLKSTETSVFTALKPPDTVDLTADAGDDIAAQRDEHCFLRKLKNSSPLRHKLQRQMKPLKVMPRSSDAGEKTFSADGAIAESTQLNGLTSPSGDYYGNPSNSSLLEGRSRNSAAISNGDCGAKKANVMNQSQFPSALDKLRVVKRNHTFNNVIGASRGHQGLTPHMRSSSSMQTQTGLLMRSNTSRQRSSGSQSLIGKGTNNRFRRIK
ncbi:hypothetical protein HG536_0E01760 [Torulaspora globosa]|uniref:RING-type domain-containing protein n=1 Tax=Torulaspora globosa TaxID=48254 RepID=A0A7G3ZIC9_9SACH|nr:uncharacterized protein HG536_0E01760 [Torulaspora globosa]QLL33265.1 hypothetical protein HG536_0E01760 [Torulaspora globosa]